jgi:diguanylate cyclase (GGDEF)-like protein
MNQFFYTIINYLDIVGIALLIITLIPLRKLMHELPHGSIRKLWQILSIMILFFIATYIVIALQFRAQNDFLSREIVCIVLFLGSLFVFMVCTLSLQTARDIKRIYALEIENITDPLMSINNRRHLDQKLEEEFAKAARYDHAFSILMIDIDHFKNVNDLYGHDIGDLVLKKLGILINTLVRETDTVARYGGEEIMLLCPLTDGHHAAWLAERLRCEIEKCVIVSSDMETEGREVLVTVSIGVAEFSSDIFCVTDLVKRADEAMYQAKNEGRNRVYIYGNSICATKESQ